MTNKPKSALQLFREFHKRDHPNCTYGDEPHFVPPSFGQIGFYMCDPPEDITNHTRCRPPFDHEHNEHNEHIQFMDPTQTGKSHMAQGGILPDRDPLGRRSRERAIARQALLDAADAVQDRYSWSEDDIATYIARFLRNRADSL